MRRASFCAALVLLLVFVLGTTASGAWIQVSGTKYDRSKKHDEIGEPNGGPTWIHNYCEDNLIVNNKHDPNENWDENWHAGWDYRKDLSCWMAVAANMIQHKLQTTTTHYDSWAYTTGILHGGKRYTFDDGGWPGYALADAGYSYIYMDKDTTGLVDPLNFLEACLREKTAVHLGIFGTHLNGDPLAHSITAYGVDKAANKIRVADSDENKGGNPTWDYTYSEVGGFKLTDYVTSPLIKQLTAFDYLVWWTAGTGNWDTAANWLNSKKPDNSKAVYFTQNNLGTVTINTAAEAKSITMGTPDATDRIVVNTGANLTVAECVTMGEENAGSGHVEHNDGNVTIGGNLYLGYEAGCTGRYTLNDGDLDITVCEFVGTMGTGEFTQNNGTNKMTELFVAFTLGSAGTYTLNGGEMVAINEHIGCEGQGTFTHTGGTNRVSGNLSLGFDGGSSGTYTLKGGNIILGVDSSFYVSCDGSGALNMEGGTIENGKVIIGQDGWLSGWGTITGSLTNDYGDETRVQVGGGTLTILGEIHGSGQYLVAPGDTLRVTGGEIGTLELEGTLQLDDGFLVNMGGTLDLRNAFLCIYKGGFSVEGGTILFPTEQVQNNTVDLAGGASVVSGAHLAFVGAGGGSVGLDLSFDPDFLQQQGFDLDEFYPVLFDFNDYCGLQFDSVEVTIRYDPAQMKHEDEEKIRVLHFLEGGGYEVLNATVNPDPDAQTITFTTTSFSEFGVRFIPEPGTIVLVGCALVALAGVVRRKMR